MMSEQRLRAECSALMRMVNGVFVYSFTSFADTLAYVDDFNSLVSDKVEIYVRLLAQLNFPIFLLPSVVASRAVTVAPDKETGKLVIQLQTSETEERTTLGDEHVVGLIVSRQDADEEMRVYAKNYMREAGSSFLKKLEYSRVADWFFEYLTSHLRDLISVHELLSLVIAQPERRSAFISMLTRARFLPWESTKTLGKYVIYRGENVLDCEMQLLVMMATNRQPLDISDAWEIVEFCGCKAVQAYSVLIPIACRVYDKDTVHDTLNYGGEIAAEILYDTLNKRIDEPEICHALIPTFVHMLNVTTYDRFRLELAIGRCMCADQENSLVSVKYLQELDSISESFALTICTILLSISEELMPPDIYINTGISRQTHLAHTDKISPDQAIAWAWEGFSGLLSRLTTVVTYTKYVRILAEEVSPTPSSIFFVAAHLHLIDTTEIKRIVPGLQELFYMMNRKDTYNLQIATLNLLRACSSLEGTMYGLFPQQVALAVNQPRHSAWKYIFNVVPRLCREIPFLTLPSLIGIQTTFQDSNKYMAERLLIVAFKTSNYSLDVRDIQVLVELAKMSLRS